MNTVGIITLDTNIILHAQFNTHALLIKATAVMPLPQSPPAAKDVPQQVNDDVCGRDTRHYPDSTHSDAPSSLLTSDDLFFCLTR